MDTVNIQAGSVIRIREPSRHDLMDSGSQLDNASLAAIQVWTVYWSCDFVIMFSVYSLTH